MLQPSMLHLDGPSTAASRLPDINGKKRTFDEETSEEERMCEDNLRAAFEARADRSISVSAIQRDSMADHPSAGPADHPNSSMPPTKSVRKIRMKMKVTFLQVQYRHAQSELIYLQHVADVLTKWPETDNVFVSI